MVISFIWDWQPDFGQTFTLADGLCAALKELELRGHTVTRYTDTKIPVPNPHGTYYPIDEAEIAKSDVILHWADATRPHAEPLSKLGIPQALCFAGGELLGPTFPYFDHIFVESQVYKEVYDRAGIACSIAFGTNTDLFTPVEGQPIQFDTIMPGTFALWKRHELYAPAVKGLRALAVGYMYETHETECWQVCLDNGVMVLPHVSAHTLKYLYSASKVCVIPSMSSGGSQRTVLEAMAMNLPVIVTDSDKFDYEHLIRVEPRVEAIREAIDAAKPIETRQYILDNWSHIHYAHALEKGLKGLL
jgi:glycosyltransferase involved in cell wall biosynthesis